MYMNMGIHYMNQMHRGLRDQLGRDTAYRYYLPFMIMHVVEIGYETLERVLITRVRNWKGLSNCEQ